MWLIILFTEEVTFIIPLLLIFKNTFLCCVNLPGGRMPFTLIVDL